MAHSLSPSTIRSLRIENPKARARDFAELHGISEAALVAAHLGQGVTALAPAPEGLMPLVKGLGEVMALTRNTSCVHERIGVYDGFHAGPHAQMILGAEIDMRIFPSHWKFAFAVVEGTEDGPKRSLQVFDAAGDAVHKVHLKPASDVAAFDALVATLRLADQSQTLDLAPRKPTDPAKGDAAAADDLRSHWDRMTDTHQFMGLMPKLKMNRLGAYRMAGAPYVRALAPESVTRALHAAANDAIPLMIFVGNAGCIQIHGGLIEKVVPMGPWINVMDPRFNLHLRADHVAEVYCVNKPTARGAAISIEAFDAEGGLILQIFGYRKDAAPDAWNALTLTLPSLATEPAKVMA
ncbi:MAG: ChuX/HutX family heme-like substrate-binding protein [Pseudomonadota bacterium]